MLAQILEKQQQKVQLYQKTASILAQISEISEKPPRKVRLDFKILDLAQIPRRQESQWLSQRQR